MRFSRTRSSRTLFSELGNFFEDLRSDVSDVDVRNLQGKQRRRIYLVRKRTGFKNKIGVELDKRGIREDPSYSEDGKKWLRSLEIDPVKDYLEIIEALNEPIDRIEEEIRREADKDEDTELVMTIPGIGFIRGLTITAEIGDI